MNQNKLLLTAILLFSLLVLVLEDNKFNNQQLVMFVLGVSALYILFMVTEQSEGFTDYKGSYAGYKYNTSCNDGGWRKEPCNKPLNETMGFVPQGTTVSPNQTDGPLSNDHKSYPSVDGEKVDGQQSGLA